jgi:hypothetical protein
MSSFNTWNNNPNKMKGDADWYIANSHKENLAALRNQLEELKKSGKNGGFAKESRNVNRQIISTKNYGVNFSIAFDSLQKNHGESAALAVTHVEKMKFYKNFLVNSK